MMRLRRARGEGGKPASDKIDRDYFENYRGLGPYSEVWSQFTDPAYLTDLIKIVWNRARGYKLLVAGSASGELVGALRERGIDAWGIENNRAIHAKTPKALKKYQQARIDRRHAVQGRRVRFRVRDQPVPRRGKAGAARGSRIESRREVRAWCSDR